MGRTRTGAHRQGKSVGRRERAQLEATTISNAEEGVGAGQGIKPRGGDTVERSKVGEECPEEFACTARGKGREIRGVIGVGRIALQPMVRGRGQGLQRAAAAAGLQEAIQRELYEARLLWLLPRGIETETEILQGVRTLTCWG